MDIFTIRPAIETDFPQIKALIDLVKINPFGLDWKNFVVAVDNDGQVISCGQLKPHRAGYHELASIGTAPNHRGRGAARAVIEELLRRGPRPLYLMCVSHNQVIYEKFGFKELHILDMPRYFQRIKKIFDAAKAFRGSKNDLLVMKLE